MPNPSPPPVVGSAPVTDRTAPPAGRRATLITSGWRAQALVLALVAAAGVAALGVLFYHGGDTRFDQRILDELVAHVSAPAGRALIHVTDPVNAVTVLAIVVVVALIRRRVDLALLALVGPAAAVFVTSVLLKPLLGRRLELMQLTHSPFPPTQIGCFPSGHETGVSSTAWVLLIACCQLPIRRWMKVTVAVVLAAWVALAAAMLTREVYHYASDTVGGFLVATAVVLGLALLLDRARPRRRVR